MITKNNWFEVDREGLKQTGVKEKILEKIGKIVLED